MKKKKKVESMYLGDSNKDSMYTDTIKYTHRIIGVML